MSEGYIFDIKEFSTNDGPGVRTTVFLRGCPLRCVWCHNPEGLEVGRGVLVREKQCLHCGRCTLPCSHPECAGLRRCLHACPLGLVEELGRCWSAEALAEYLLRDSDFLTAAGGGITLSGGEPLLQAEFARELLSRLPLHRAIETSGYASPEVFASVMEETDYVLFDLKLADPSAHRRYTGVDNARIHENLGMLRRMGKAHTIRIPLIPGITDTTENLSALAVLVGDSPCELLSYNRMAGTKYPWVGKIYTDLIKMDENAPPDLSLFSNATWIR